MKINPLRLSTALVSDVLDNLGYRNQMLSAQIKPNFNEAKIFGKARIMSLKPIAKGESYREIYQALYFLESLSKGDILLVAHAFNNYAFFGELMSTLARSRHVDGAVIDGYTRDKIETMHMKYPVFSKGNVARDIKKRGIIDKVDLNSVRIGSVLIKKGDYLLGDLDGVIVIPKELKEIVLKEGFRIRDKERKIKKSIKGKKSLNLILKKFGEF